MTQLSLWLMLHSDVVLKGHTETNILANYGQGHIDTCDYWLCQMLCWQLKIELRNREKPDISLFSSLYAKYLTEKDCFDTPLVSLPIGSTQRQVTRTCKFATRVYYNTTALHGYKKLKLATKLLSALHSQTVTRYNEND